MDVWCYRISVACDIMEYHKGDVRRIWIRSPITYASVVYSTTWPPQTMWQTHAPTFKKWHKKKKKKKTLHMLTHGAMLGCGLTSSVVCINDKFCDIRERNVTIRNENGTMNIHSLGCRDIREYMTLWWLVLWSLGCIFFHYGIVCWDDNTCKHIIHKSVTNMGPPCSVCELWTCSTCLQQGRG